MATRATIRVRSAGGEGTRPERQDLEAAAQLLADKGFAVLRIGRFGVSVEGEQADFARELGVDASRPEGLVEAPSGAANPLLDLIDLVEVTPSPESF